VAGPFNIALTPNTSQGRMVGDYISTSWIGGKAFGAFAVAKVPTNSSAFDQAIYLPTGGTSAATSGFINTSKGDRPVPGAASDHAAPTSPIRNR